MLADLTDGAGREIQQGDLVVGIGEGDPWIPRWVPIARVPKTKPIGRRKGVARKRAL
jgi:hypothetical protein